MKEVVIGTVDKRSAGRAAPKVSECATCGEPTTHGKPYCIDHLADLLRIKALVQAIDGDVSDDRAEDVMSVLLRGPIPAFRLYRMCRLNPREGKRIVAAMKKLGQVTCYRAPTGAKKKRSKWVKLK